MHSPNQIGKYICSYNLYVSREETQKNLPKTQQERIKMENKNYKNNSQNNNEENEPEYTIADVYEFASGFYGLM